MTALDRAPSASPLRLGGRPHHHSYCELPELEIAECRKTHCEKPMPLFSKALTAARLVDALFSVERQINRASVDGAR